MDLCSVVFISGLPNPFMVRYPDGVLTRDRRGNPEVRWLVDRGRFVRYQYRDPGTGKLLENGKFSVVLKGSGGKEEHFYLIPVGNRFLAIPLKEGSMDRKVWDGRKAAGLF